MRSHRDRRVIAGRSLAHPIHGIAFLLPRQKLVPLPVLEDQMHNAPDLVYGRIGERFYLLCVSLPQFEEPLLDLRRLDRQWSQISPAGNNALDEVSLVGLDGGERLGTAPTRLADSPFALASVLPDLCQSARRSLA